MELTTPIPYSFIRERLNLSWCDALWGYERQMIGWSGIVDLATDRLCAGSNDHLEIELASLNKTETSQIGDLLRELASSSHEGDCGLAQKKWLYLMLSWLFKNKASIHDALEEVETIYADFDYPSEIESFVRYMPVTDGYNPNIHNKNENEKRLFDNWRKYLESAEHEFNNWQ